MCHHGNFYAGHYTARCWDTKLKQWVCYNDHIVSLIDKNEVNDVFSQKDAYTLFYQLDKIADSQFSALKVFPKILDLNRYAEITGILKPEQILQPTPHT